MILMEKLRQIEDFKDKTGKISALYDDRKGSSLQKAYELSVLTGNKEREERVEGLVNKLLILKHPGSPVIEIPPEEPNSNPIIIGRALAGDEEKHEVGVSLEDLTKHGLITGTTGSGKSRVGNLIAHQLIEAEVPALIIDPHGGATNLIKTTDKKVRAFIVDEIPFKLNIFNSTSDPESLFSVFSEILSWEYEGTVGLTAQMSYVVYKEIKNSLGYINGTQEFINRVKNCKPGIFLPELPKTISAIITRLRAISDGRLGKVFNGSNTNIAEFFEHPTILDTRFLNSMENRILSNLVLTLILDRAKFLGPTNKLRLVIVIDEAQHLAYQIKRQVTSEDKPVTSRISEEFRKYGIGLICITQRLANIDQNIISNSHTLIGLRTLFQDDKKALQNFLNLDKESMEYVDVMEERTAFVRVPQFPTAFLVRIPEYSLPSVSIQEVRQYMKDNFPDLFEVEEDIELTEVEEQFLLSVHEDQFQTLTQRYKQFGTKSGLKTKEKLVSKGFLKEVDINLGRKYGRRKYLEITEEGYQYLSRLGIQKVGPKESFEHKLWKNYIADYYKKRGYNYKVEYPVGDNFIDVVVSNGERVAIEFFMDHRTTKDNLNKFIKNGDNFSRILFVARNKEVKERIEKILEESEATENILPLLLTDFLE